MLPDVDGIELVRRFKELNPQSEVVVVSGQGNIPRAVEAIKAGASYFLEKPIDADGMSVWLTPDLKPFFGGTYFPPTARWQRPGFIDVLLEIARAWKSERASIETSAQQMVEGLQTLGGSSDALLVPGDDALRRTVAQFGASYDARRGGFGDAPKFPRPSELLFLFREYARTGDEPARDMLLQ